VSDPESGLELLKRVAAVEYDMPLPISWDLKITFADGTERAMAGSMHGRGTYGLNGKDMLGYELCKAMRRIVRERAREIAGVEPSGTICP
jgi:hypothetical protein